MLFGDQKNIGKKDFYIRKHIYTRQIESKLSDNTQPALSKSTVSRA